MPSTAATGWLDELFGVAKPVIAMAHLPALPGTPRYDRGRGIDGMIEQLAEDVRRLLDGGVDAVMFCNEDDRPYRFSASLADAAVMARIVTELRPPDRPFGVDYLWDAHAALAVAAATGANFLREVVTGVYESDMGLWQPDAAALYRERDQLGAGDVRVLANITPEFGSPLGDRDLGARAKSATVSTLVDAVLISGPMAGAEPSVSHLKAAKDAAGGTPVFLNTGAQPDNVAEFLRIADGVVVGSALKVDGRTWNPVDAARVTAFMAEVKTMR